MTWKAGGDGKPVTFNRIPWHEDKHGYCPVLGAPCNCSEGGLAKAHCRRMVEVAQNEKSPGESE